MIANATCVNHASRKGKEPEVFGQRLRLARKKAGLSMRELAGRTSPPVSAQAISKYEAGKMMPSSRVLVGLGKELAVSLDFLMSGQVEALEAVEFRKHSRTSAKDRARAEVLVTEQLENYLAIEDILDLEPAPDPFHGLRSDQVQSLDDTEYLADRLREEWDLGLDPIPSMTGLLESKGIRVIEADLPERFHGLACTVKLAGGRPDTEAVVVSRQDHVRAPTLHPVPRIGTSRDSWHGQSKDHRRKRRCIDSPQHFSFRPSTYWDRPEATGMASPTVSLSA